MKCNVREIPNSIENTKFRMHKFWKKKNTLYPSEIQEGTALIIQK